MARDFAYVFAQIIKDFIATADYAEEVGNVDDIWQFSIANFNQLAEQEIKRKCYQAWQDQNGLCVVQIGAKIRTKQATRNNSRLGNSKYISIQNDKTKNGMPNRSHFVSP